MFEAAGMVKCGRLPQQACAAAIVHCAWSPFSSGPMSPGAPKKTDKNRHVRPPAPVATRMEKKIAVIQSIAAFAAVVSVSPLLNAKSVQVYGPQDTWHPPVARVVLTAMDAATDMQP